MKIVISIIFWVALVPIWIMGFLARLAVEAYLVGYTNTAGNFVKYLRS